MNFNMYDLTIKDKELIKMAKETIKKNYDSINFNHTVAAAILTKSGKIYTGINVYSIHGACAEQIAIGKALTDGEREFEAIVAVRGKDGEEIIPPCGNCRQILSDYMPNIDIILKIDNDTKKINIKELLPFSYITNN